MSKFALVIGNLPVTSDEADALLTRIGGGYVSVWKGTSEAESVRSDVEVIITADHAVTRADIEPWPNVKMLSLAFTGYDHVDLSYCRERNLYVYYVPDYSKASVAELVVLLTLAVLRRLPQADRNTRTGKFDGDGVQPGVELEGSTVGIIGTGKIGTHTARKFLAMGCKVVGWNRSERREFMELGSKFASLGPEYEGCLDFSTDLTDVLQQADIVSLHLATNEQTQHFADKAFFSNMRQGSVLINTARGRLVKTNDLVAALERGYLAGAGIDVYDPEPVPKKDQCESEALRELLNMNQVVLTPHLGFKTDKSLRRLVEETITNVGRYTLRVRGKHHDLDVRKNCLLHGPDELEHPAGGSDP